MTRTNTATTPATTAPAPTGSLPAPIPTQVYPDCRRARPTTGRPGLGMAPTVPPTPTAAPELTGPSRPRSCPQGHLTSTRQPMAARAPASPQFSAGPPAPEPQNTNTASIKPMTAPAATGFQPAPTPTPVYLDYRRVRPTTGRSGPGTAPADPPTPMAARVLTGPS